MVPGRTEERIEIVPEYWLILLADSIALMEEAVQIVQAVQAVQIGHEGACRIAPCSNTMCDCKT